MQRHALQLARAALLLAAELLADLHSSKLFVWPSWLPRGLGRTVLAAAGVQSCARQLGASGQLDTEAHLQAKQEPGQRKRQAALSAELRWAVPALQAPQVLAAPRSEPAAAWHQPAARRLFPGWPAQAALRLKLAGQGQTTAEPG